MADNGANANMRFSAAGQRALATAEAVRRAYYNDQGDNCTYGQGTLVHYGPCTAAELASPVSEAMILRSLNHDIATAERLVRQAVRGRALTQSQFDAAVSFVYNTGRPDVLRPANNGDMAAVARRMRSFVMVCRHDPHGRVVPGSCRASHGLIHRRRLEAAPFSSTQGRTP